MGVGWGQPARAGCRRCASLLRPLPQPYPYPYPYPYPSLLCPLPRP